MFFIILSILLCSLYFALESYHFGVIVNSYEIIFNPSLVLITLLIVFFAGAALTSQVFYFKDFVNRLKYQSLTRRYKLQKDRIDFEREATLFLLEIAHVKPLWIDDLQDSYYRPHYSFQHDVKLWQKFIVNKDFQAAYDIIKNSEPYLPKEYTQVWLQKTMTLDLELVSQESELKRVLRRIPPGFYKNEEILVSLAAKFSLFSLKKEALAHINKISPHFITQPIQKSLWFWMREDCAYWFQQLKRLWSYNQVLSPEANILMVKLALSTDFVGQAREYLDNIPASSDRFYLEHILSLQADKRIELLSSQGSWPK